MLTAAHCIDSIGLRNIVVRVGDWQFGAHDVDEKEFEITSFGMHNRFGQRKSYSNDIALLRLELRNGVGIEFGPYVQPACLPAADTIYEPYTECEVSGWGKTSDGAPVSEKLNAVKVPLVSDEFCSTSEVHQNRFVHGQMFCSGLVRGGPDACGGDSGGPLVCLDPDSDRFVAYGIVSSGDPQGCGRLPGLYTKVSHFAGWLLRRLQLVQLDLEESAAAQSAQHISTDLSLFEKLVSEESAAVRPAQRPSTNLEEIAAARPAQHTSTKPSLISRSWSPDRVRPFGPPSAPVRTSKRLRPLGPPSVPVRTLKRVRAARPAKRPSTNLEKIAAARPAQRPSTNFEESAPARPAQRPSTNLEEIAAARPAQRPSTNFEESAPARPAQRPSTNLEEIAAARPAQRPSTAPRDPPSRVTSSIFFPSSRPVPAPPSLPAPPVRPSTDMLSVPNSECGRSNFSPPEGVGAAFAQDPADFPWLVSIYLNGTMLCSGTVIADRWILTKATDCAEELVKDVGSSPEAHSAVLNVYTESPSVRVGITRVELHPLYKSEQGNEPNSQYAIGLMETSSIITLKEDVRAHLPSRSAGYV